MPDELVNPTPVETPPEQPPQEPLATEPAAQPVDNPPDPASLDPEVKRLQEVRDKARMDAEYWRKEKAQARADYFKSRQEPGVPYSPPRTTPQPGEPKSPNQEDFDDYKKYQDAHSKYVQDLVDYRTTQKIRSWETELTQRSAQVQYQQKMSSLQERLNEGFQKFGDFEEVALSETVPINNLIVEVLSESESPADVAYYLGKNRAEAIQISRMTPVGAARAIARIEMALKQNPFPTTPNNPLRKVTNAPPPPKPVGSFNSVGKDLEKMSQKEFESEMERRTGRRF